MTATPTRPAASEAASGSHRFASPVDAARWGEYRRPAAPAHAFAGRVTDAVPGRYHVYGGWSCPASHRLAVIRAWAGLEDVVSMSYIDELRDARGWAFREATGPDPVNGFTLLREVYLAADPGYAGIVSVPVLWDRVEATVRSTSPVGIGIDLATAFAGLGRTDRPSLRPAALVPAIDAMSRRVATEIERQVGCAVYRRQVAADLRTALAGFDRLLADRPHLVGEHVTDADVRLWVQLVRYDAGPNAHKAVGPRLDAFPHLWAWARRLYALAPFRTTTDFTRFSAPLADLPPW
ncbi:putative glutathione S-transferase [Jatrophihabitans endophyticus]|uniref:Putative glutathione S-transferase n=1 Tax=Jatrophihabitans endophyticus TaxID=1206085 RepID=A0A1M5K7G2_9ACTN|nr:glutathione S-transferase C-terminal domain-containing protein [Jatrophihabitans endophyticus]SHG48449.1 putative glutathione S-transferase [Jatrophihabitans endophyticus]